MKSSPAEAADHARADRVGATDLAGLSQAAHSLWLATLSLMTAFMQTAAPAHRLMLARRIARNFTTLRELECFTPGTRESFAKLAARWQLKVDRLSPSGEAQPGVLTRLQRLLAR